FDAQYDAQLVSISVPKVVALQNIQLDDCPALQRVEFSALTTVTGLLQVNGSAALADLSGFHAVTSIGNLDIYGSRPPVIRGIHSVASIGNVSIIGSTGNAVLDLPNLTSITNELRLGGYTTATAPGSLPKLAHVGSLAVYGQTTMTSLAGLESLRT